MLNNEDDHVWLSATIYVIPSLNKYCSYYTRNTKEPPVPGSGYTSQST